VVTDRLIVVRIGQTSKGGVPDRTDVRLLPRATDKVTDSATCVEQMFETWGRADYIQITNSGPVVDTTIRHSIDHGTSRNAAGRNTLRHNACSRNEDRAHP
jgi:hypothetical protein